MICDAAKIPDILDGDLQINEEGIYYSNKNKLKKYGSIKVLLGKTGRVTFYKTSKKSEFYIMFNNDAFNGHIK